MNCRGQGSGGRDQGTNLKASDGASALAGRHACRPCGLVLRAGAVPDPRFLTPAVIPLPLALGIDPGTLSIDLCGIEDGRCVVDESVPTSAALDDPTALVQRIASLGPFACIAGPSGYGLPLVRGMDLSDEALHLALLAPPGGGDGGIGGLGALLRTLARSALPVVFTPGVAHLPSVPTHRKVNRVDLGTADKLCATMLAIDDQARRHACSLAETSLILLELGGAFTAAIAVAGGRIVDGIGGSVASIGARACGALDAEVAALAGHITKSMVFRGGAADVRGDGVSDGDVIAHPTTPRQHVAWDAYVEGACKVVAALGVAVPQPREIVLSGRLVRSSAVYRTLADRLSATAPVVRLDGFARVAKQAAQGAALLANGLAGGEHAPLVEHLGLREASGTVLDGLYVISQAQARAALGLPSQTAGSPGPS